MQIFGNPSEENMDTESRRKAKCWQRDFDTIKWVIDNFGIGKEWDRFIFYINQERQKKGILPDIYELCKRHNAKDSIPLIDN